MSAGDDGIFTRALLKRRVKLAAKLQNRHALDSIGEILRANVEGVCGPDGYIRPRSVNIVDVSPGIVEMSSLSGHAVYNVRFTADVCNPAVGDVLTCRVENVNSYGVLAVNTSDTRVLEVILQHAPVSFEHSESMEGIEPGDTVTLEVMCRHFKLGQRTITLVGRAVGKDHVPRPAEVDSDDEDVDVVSDADGSDVEDQDDPVDDAEAEADDEEDEAEIKEIPDMDDGDDDSDDGEAVDADDDAEVAVEDEEEEEEYD